MLGTNRDESTKNLPILKTPILLRCCGMLCKAQLSGLLVVLLSKRFRLRCYLQSQDLDFQWGTEKLVRPGSG